MVDNAILNNFDELLDNPTQTQEEEIEEPVVEEPLNKTEEEEQPIQDPAETEEEEEEPDYSNNSIYLFLQERGVKDPGKIKFTNEDDTEEEIDFNSLSTEEQLEVLKQVTDPGLSEEEISTINYLRHNNTTLQQVIDYWAQKRLDDYLNEHPEAVHQKQYEVDDYSDDDLYLTDLRHRYPDFSDEELLAELESAKENEDLFKKKTEILRNTYKAEEDQAEAARQQQEAQQVEDLRNNLMDAASRFNEVQLDYTDDKSDSLVIDEEDKQQMMSYILNQDSEGKSQLVRDLEDPDRLIEIAWFSTQGPKMLSELTKYWKGLLAEERAENKKLQAKLDKINKTGTSTVVSTRQPRTETNKGGESI
jgi:hypothetical protein